MIRICIVCGKAFKPKAPHGSDKSCSPEHKAIRRRATDNARRQKNRERVRILSRARYARNSARILARMKKWREKNRERHNAVQRARYARNREKARALARKYYRRYRALMYAARDLLQGEKAL